MLSSEMPNKGKWQQAEMGENNLIKLAFDLRKESNQYYKQYDELKNTTEIALGKKNVSEQNCVLHA